MKDSNEHLSKLRRDLYGSLEKNNESECKTMTKVSVENEVEKELLKKILQEQEKGINLCNHKIDISNDCYDLIEKKLNKINFIIESFEKKLHNPDSKSLEKLVSKKKCKFI
jgi:hypothetical protein